MEVNEVSTAELRRMAAPYNPRTISDHDLVALGRSMSEFGVVEPMVVNKRTGRIIGGHTGASVPDLSRRHGIVENTIYRWKSKYGGMEVSEAKRLRVLESENAKLKKLLAEAELDKAALKEIVEGKW